MPTQIAKRLLRSSSSVRFTCPGVVLVSFSNESARKWGQCWFLWLALLSLWMIGIFSLFVYTSKPLRLFNEMSGMNIFCHSKLMGLLTGSTFAKLKSLYIQNREMGSSENFCRNTVFLLYPEYRTFSERIEFISQLELIYYPFRIVAARLRKFRPRKFPVDYNLFEDLFLILFDFLFILIA